MHANDNGPGAGSTPARTATRRRALKQLGAFLAGSPLLVGQLDPFRDHSRVPRIEAVAYAKVPRAAYNYTAYGSETEFTLRRNREAFEWVEIVSQTRSMLRRWIPQSRCSGRSCDRSAPERARWEVASGRQRLGRRLTSEVYNGGY
jgi:hypothetical protein